MTGKRRVGRQDLKAVRLLAVLLVTLALMLQMDGQMDAAYAGQQMPGSSRFWKRRCFISQENWTPGRNWREPGKRLARRRIQEAGTAVGQVAGTQTGLEVPSGS